MSLKLSAMADELIPEVEDRAPALTFDRVYRDHRDKILGAVRSVLGYDEETEDVVQLACIEIHRSLSSFRGKSRVSTWVYRVSVNVALQHIRRKKRRRWLSLGLDDTDRDRRRTTGDAESRLASRQALERVYEIIDRLSEKKRTAWVLYEMEGLEPAEIAAVLEVPLNTVRSRILSARREILTALDVEDGGP